MADFLKAGRKSTEIFGDRPPVHLPPDMRSVMVLREVTDLLAFLSRSTSRFIDITLMQTGLCGVLKRKGYAFEGLNQ